MDFVDVCEELASEYAVLPHKIMKLPWVHVKILWQTFMRRRRRQLDYDAATRGIGPEGMFGGSPAHGVRLPGPPPLSPHADRDLGERDIDRMQSMGFPVEIRENGK